MRASRTKGALAALVATAVALTPGTAAAAEPVRPIQEALAADGTLDARSGSYDARGYRMAPAADGRPRFVRATAADAPWDDRFGLGGAPGVDEFRAVAVDGGQVYIGGRFATTALEAAIPMNHVARWDGRRWSALGTGTNGPVTALAARNGVVYAAGDFTAAGGTAAAHVARWDGTTWSPLGAGLAMGGGDAVRVGALALDGGTLYVGGRFDRAGTVPAAGVARWSGTVWSALGAGLQRCDAAFTAGGRCSATPALGEVRALALFEGRLHAGGDFNLAGGTRADSLARWTGTAWQPVAGAVTARPGERASVTALAADTAALYVGGGFTSIGGVAARGVARYAGGTFAPLGTGLAPRPGTADPAGVPTAMAVRDGRLFVAGPFEHAGDVLVRGFAQWTGAAWSPVGAVLDGFGVSPAPTAVGAGPDGVVFAGRGTLAAGGGTVAFGGVGLWTGTELRSFGLGVGNERGDGEVLAVAARGRDLYVAGQVLRAGWLGLASPRRANIARFDGSRWHPLGGGLQDGQANAIVIDGTDVYVGGRFSQAGDVPAANVARWNGTSWSALGSGTDGEVLALHVHRRKLYAGGRFTAAGGVAAPAAAVWDLGSRTWSALPGTPSFGAQPVTAIGAFEAPYDRYVVLGGDFEELDGFRVNRVVALDVVDGRYVFFPEPDGATATAGIRCADFCRLRAVRALETAGPVLYVGGQFDRGGAANARGLAAFDLQTGRWSAPGSIGGPADSYVGALQQVGTTLFAGGRFTGIGGVAANNVARLRAGAWSPLGTGVTHPVSVRLGVDALAQSSQGLYAGGSFARAGDLASHGVALWRETAWPVTITQAGPTTTSFTNAATKVVATVQNTSTTTTSAPLVVTSRLPATAIPGTPRSDVGTCSRTGVVVTCRLGALAPGAAATITLALTPVEPGTTTIASEVRPAEGDDAAAASTALVTKGRAQTSYFGIRDTGFTPTTITAPPGQTVVFNLLGAKAHGAADGTGLGLFDTGLLAPVATRSYRFTAVGTYAVTDAGGTRTGKVNVPPVLPAGPVKAGDPVAVTVAAAAPPSGLVIDLQVQPPGSTSWRDACAGTTATSCTFRPAKAGTAAFRGRLRATAGGASSWSPVVALPVG